jgi:hypothetical protein
MFAPAQQFARLITNRTNRFGAAVVVQRGFFF